METTKALNFCKKACFDGARMKVDWKMEKTKA